MTSMFQRRLALLAIVALVPTLAMAAQLFRLTVVDRDEHLDRVESKLVRRAWIPTTRGRILDRKGRVLAVDRAAFELAVDYEVIDGSWAKSQAERHARRANIERWANLSPAEREPIIASYHAAYDQRVEAMWVRVAQISGIDRARLDARLDEITTTVERMHAHLTTRRIDSLTRERLDTGQTLNDAAREDIRRQASSPIAEQRRPHIVAAGLDDAAGFRFLRLATEATPLAFPGGERDDRPIDVPLFPGLEVRNADTRLYPFDTVAVDVNLATLPRPVRRDGATSIVIEGVASTLLGGLRDEVFREDAQRRSDYLDSHPSEQVAAMVEGVDRGAYRPGDLVGSSGVEAAHEATLRGLRGLRTRRVDSGEVREVQPRPGTDLVLSIDVALQARVRAAMAPELGLASVQPWHGEPDPLMPFGTPIYGAAVVMDIETAEILAIVSTPSPRDRSDEPVPEPGSAEAIARARQDAVESTAINRAFARPYQPGSIVKPLMVCAAERDGNYRLGQPIVCTGHFLPNREDVMRCWIYKRHGITHSQDGVGLNAEHAIERSCNIFFYELGRRMGSSGVAAAYRELGVGEPFELDAGLEHPGLIADPSALGSSDGIFMAMGQGPVAWTPVHAAEAYAALARGGHRFHPRLVLDGASPAPAAELRYSERAVAASMEGLRLAVTSPNGTGTFLPAAGRLEPMFTIEGVELWGKTGTAQTSDLEFDPDGPDGPMPPETLRRGEHAWFVVMVAPEGETTPRYVVSVVMEYGGSGGRVSGPVANQILHALRVEGYL